MKKIFLAAALALLTAGPGVVFAQQARVALKGNACAVQGEKYVMLEIDGKTVVTEKDGCRNFKTSTGNYFVAEFLNGMFRLYDRSGKIVPLGGVYLFHKLSSVDGTVVAQISEETAPKYYSENDLSVEIKAQALEANHFEKEIERKGGFSPKLAGQRADVEAMKKALVEVDRIGWFDLKNNDKGSLDLVVDGKVLFTATSFSLLSDAAEYKKSNCWFFRITRGSHYPRYGVYAISMFMKDGKKVVENAMLIPYEYTFISHDGGNVVKCTTKSGAAHYFNWWGWHFNRDWRTGKYTPTNERWTYDESTDKWALVKQEPKE